MNLPSTSNEYEWKHSNTPLPPDCNERQSKAEPHVGDAFYSEGPTVRVVKRYVLEGG
jgi:hypothetical protein